jgi:alpha-N-arabinofuranosidase
MGVSAASGRILTADRMQAHNSFEAPNQVHPADFQGLKLRDNQVTFDLPPMSVTVLQLT